MSTKVFAAVVAGVIVLEIALVYLVLALAADTSSFSAFVTERY